MQSFKSLAVTFALILCAALQVHASALSDLAGSMQPGTFALLNQDGDGSGYGSTLTTSGVGGIYGYADKALYDPIDDRVHFGGAGHDVGNGAPFKQIRYKVALNQWEDMGNTCVCWHHALDNISIDAAKREYYWKEWYGGRMRRMNLATMAWDSIPSCPVTSAGSIEYFPERGELLAIGYDFFVWDRRTNTWRAVKSMGQLPGLGYSLPIARYNPVHKVVMLLGGRVDYGGALAPAVYKYDSNGVVTRMADMPSGIGMYIISHVLTVDPVSGEYLVLSGGAGAGVPYELWAYNIVSDAWRKLAVTLPTNWTQAANDVFSVVATPLSTYGVVMFMSAAYANSKVFLYKHAGGTAAAGLGSTPGHGVISVSPNPAGNTACVILQGLAGKTGPVSVYNIHGKRVRTLEPGGAGGTALKTDKLPAGMYIVSVAVGDCRYSAKFLVR